MENFITYPTIEAAFLNGPGDCFFTKNGGFICTHRRDIETHDRLLANGFKHRILTLEELRRPTKEEATPAPSVIENLSRMAKSYSSATNGQDGYYDEFPDAYGQSL